MASLQVASLQAPRSLVRRLSLRPLLPFRRLAPLHLPLLLASSRALRVFVSCPQPFAEIISTADATIAVHTTHARLTSFC